MPITIPTFGHITLTESVNKMVRPSKFITNLLFGKVKTHGTKTVQVDIIVGKRRLAPFVRRGKEAIVVGDLGQKTQTFEPPNMRFKKDLDADQLLFNRAPGMPVHITGSSGDMMQRARMQKIAEEQADMRDTIDRTIEYMGCQALKGSYTITAHDGVFSIDFSMPVDNKPILAGGRTWDNPDTAKPLTDVREKVLVARKASGKIPTVAIMTTATWNLFIACQEVKDTLDNRKIDLGSVTTPPEVLAMGARKMAEIENVTYYTYDEFYVDESGNDVSMIPDNYVALVSPSADNRLHFGAIEDLKAGTNIGRYFSKDWITEDPSVYWVLVESHPLPVTHQPEANIWMKVA